MQGAHASTRIVAGKRRELWRDNPMNEPPGSTSVDPDNVCLAYLSCPQDGAKGYLGALLVTDGRTRPLHFGYVAPVRPTIMQRILYGRTLDVHVKMDVIARKLVQDGISKVPDVLFVDAEDLLAARPIFNVPTARLTRPEAKQSGVTISTYRYDAGGRAQDEEAVGRIVTALEQTVDLLDPFKRMEGALKEALKELSK